MQQNETTGPGAVRIPYRAAFKTVVLLLAVTSAIAVYAGMGWVAINVFHWVKASVWS